MTIKHDYTGVSGALYDAYMYGKNESGLANQILGIQSTRDTNLTMDNDQTFDMSDPAEPSQTVHTPTVEYGSSGTSESEGSPPESEADSFIREATDQEFTDQHIAIEAEAESAKRQADQNRT